MSAEGWNSKVAETEKKSEDQEQEWTGERYLPEIEGDIAAEHLHRYALAREIVAGKDVLDIACGEGYGSNLLRDMARSVIGVDSAESTISHATARYLRPDLKFRVGLCDDIPLENQSVDVVISFETIEHHNRHAEMLEEIKRVLRPGGVLIISSPDKHEYSDVPGSMNPFHVKELYLHEFHSLLKAQFCHIALYGQRVDHGSLIAPLESGVLAPWYSFTETAGEIRRETGVSRPLFFIAIASDGPLPSLPAGIFSDLTFVLRRDRQLEATHSELNSAYGQIAAYQRQAVQFAEMLKSAQTDLSSAHNEIISLRQSTIDSNAQIQSLSKAVDEEDARIRMLTAELAAANSTIASMVSSMSWRVTGILRRMKFLTSKGLGPLRQALDGNAPPHRPGSTDAGKVSNAARNAASLNAMDSVLSPDDLVERKRFDPDFYLKLYPDVRENFHGDPYEHFATYGKAEGRLGFPPPFIYSGDFDRLNPLRENVLVVSHEASTTGAPVLSLNIILELKAKYNVIMLILKGGSLVDDLQASADIVVGPVGSQAGIVVRLQLEQLMARCSIRFAVVNSIESRAVLPELARHFIPSVALIHEFASYTRPRNAIEEAIFWASETIFSADIVRDNAIAAFPDLSLRLPSVIPQGRCSRALTSPDELSSKIESDRIQKVFRPSGWPADTPVVLGVGTVHIRKGVDLFVACAARVAQARRCRFIWIGSGYEPDRDMEFSAYLEDQIERAGLADCFAFMSETSRIDVAYEKADVLIVSSRLDPLPNVSIDAVSRGLPLVCFDKATGIADILRKNGLAKECVAPFLDVERLAMCVLAFLESPELRRRVVGQLREIGEKTFNMASYVERIEKFALEHTQHVTQECVDCVTIAENPNLDMDYLTGKRGKEPGLEWAVRRFVRSWENGFSLRKPYPGFHPGIYLENCGATALESNPLAHYMRAGYPKGRWSYDVIDPSAEENDSVKLQSLSVALHLHVYYPELAPIIIERLNANKLRPDLFISVPTEAVRIKVEFLCRAYEGRVVDVQCVPNRGRDIGAFLTAFGDRTIRNYEFVGHFHTKKTAELADKTMGETWFQFLLENLLGGRYKMADTILQKMSADPSIGLVFPDDPFVVGWSKNREPAGRLAARLGLPEPQQTYFNFPVGTMFWARSSAIRALTALNLDWNDYPEEPLPPDGTILHAIERMLPFIAEASFFRSVLTNVSGVTR